MKLITLRLEYQTRTHDYWIVGHGNKLHTVHTKRGTLKGMDRLRHAIQRAVGPNTATLSFLANRRMHGKWITEWIMQ